MSQATVGARTTIDFRTLLHPSRAWILGVHGGEMPDRVDLLAQTRFESRSRTSLVVAAPQRPRSPLATALLADCACPDFCERDHANE